MNVLVTGATGFVGRHVVAQLLVRGHRVIAVGRSPTSAALMPWIRDVTFLECDVHERPEAAFERDSIGAVIHLAWPGLPNYSDFFHVEENLPGALRFIKIARTHGVSHIIVAGTCLEYGMQYGPLGEEFDTRPITAYGLAKDTLRKTLEQMQRKDPFTFQWVRLFYMYGPGQNPNSLLAQLDRAIDEGRTVFKMSLGDQLRDYLPVDRVASHFVRLLDHPSCQGVVNCCSGDPISVRQLVEDRCRERATSIELERGFYPYPSYEPLAFWGIPGKLNLLMQG